MSVDLKRAANGGSSPSAEKRPRTEDSTPLAEGKQDEAQDKTRRFKLIKLVDEEERVNDEREISMAGYAFVLFSSFNFAFCSQATLSFVNLDITASRAVVVFADCHGKLLPAYFERGFTDDLKNVRPGEVCFLPAF